MRRSAECFTYSPNTTIFACFYNRSRKYSSTKNAFLFWLWKAIARRCCPVPALRRTACSHRQKTRQRILAYCVGYFFLARCNSLLFQQKLEKLVFIIINNGLPPDVPTSYTSNNTNAAVASHHCPV